MEASIEGHTVLAEHPAEASPPRLSSPRTTRHLVDRIQYLASIDINQVQPQTPTPNPTRRNKNEKTVPTGSQRSSGKGRVALLRTPSRQHHDLRQSVEHTV